MTIMLDIRPRDEVETRVAEAVEPTPPLEPFAPIFGRSISAAEYFTRSYQYRHIAGVDENVMSIIDKALLTDAAFADWLAWNLQVVKRLAG